MDWLVRGTRPSVRVLNMAKLPTPIHETVSAIYRHYETEAVKTERRSNGIGISTLGEKCERKLWYDFRWVSEIAKFEGRMLRLFETGKREELRLVEDLRNIGCEVHVEEPETGKQIRVEDFGGHLSGYLDGVIRGLPESKKWHVLEAKTHSAKNFAKLKNHGLKEGHPKHYTQCQMGMGLCSPRLERALYLATHKDTDEIFQERIEFDFQHFTEQRAKAERIIKAETPPERINEKPESWDCKYCDHNAFCHAEKLPQMNCRTCLHVTPILEAGAWECSKHSKTLTKEEQLAGCSNHLFIPVLLPWEPIDATEDSVLYRDNFGRILTNYEGGKIA